MSWYSHLSAGLATLLDAQAQEFLLGWRRGIPVVVCAERRPLHHGLHAGRETSSSRLPATCVISVVSRRDFHLGPVELVAVIAKLVTTGPQWKTGVLTTESLAE